MVRRTALMVAALLALASLPMVAGVRAVGASPHSASSVALAGPVPGGDDAVTRSAPAAPRDRGGDVDDDDEQARREEDEELEQEPCPKELWNIPLEIKGLACILLLPKNDGSLLLADEDDDDEDEDNNTGNGHRRR